QNAGLTSYIRQVQFEGSSGPISFDENGDAFGGYTIKHFIPTDSGYASIQVGSWNRSSESLKLNESDLYWNTNDTIPVSKCSEECNVGEIRIQLELPCCWDCFKCHANDIVINGSVCIKCPMFTWPDESTATDCELIEPDFINLLSDSLFLSLFILTMLGLVTILFMLGLFIHWRGEKIIRASSREFN
ncbi:unnamed protein product, partial [Owenia fusiformis]